MEIIKQIVEIDRDIAGYDIITSKQIIHLYIDNNNNFCEEWGYFWCNDVVEDFIGAELLRVTLTDDVLNEAFLIKKGCENIYEGNIMFVNLETSKGTLQFVAYNIHNGYYGHPATVECSQLTHSEVL